ncbi:MAG: helix-turn-helix domain-containing protein [Erysipelotrichaceae bacterium]|nr:helix-turn-helix domain-containing protein [Erysipelotrichaceae bacterium]
MDNLGDTIRKKREAKNLTIDELSAATKISVAVLKDIEEGKLDRYKGDEAYVKMYLKKISRVLDFEQVELEELTSQYLALTRELEIEDLKDKEMKEQHNKDAVTRSKKLQFEKPHLARHDSVYEDKQHVKIIQGGIILALVLAIIAVVWFGIYFTSKQSNDPTFESTTNTQAEGDINTENSDSETTNSTNEDEETTTTNAEVTIVRNDVLDYSFLLSEESDTFTFTIEYYSACWASMSVNDESYDSFVSKIYHDESEYEDETVAETVTLEFNVDEFESLNLRNGNNGTQKYYINGQEIELTDEDTNDPNPCNFILTLESETSNESTE